MLQQRVGEGAVAVPLAVERRRAGIGGKGDQDAGGGLGLDRLQAAGDRARAGSELAGEGIVAAGVEDDDVDPLVALHLAQDELHIDGAEIEIGLGPQGRVDGDEIVLVADGDAMPGIVDQARLGAVELLGELAHQIGHVVHLEVVAFDDIETEALERRRHASGVPHRIGQGRHRRIGAVADDERHAALGNGSLGGRTERNSTEHQRKGRSHSSTERRNPSCEAHHNLPCSIKSRNAAGGGRSRDRHD